MKQTYHRKRNRRTEDPTAKSKHSLEVTIAFFVVGLSKLRDSSMKGLTAFARRMSALLNGQSTILPYNWDNVIGKTLRCKLIEGARIAFADLD